MAQTDPRTDPMAQEYLVDRSTGAVYEDCKRDKWPVMAGWLKGDKVEFPEGKGTPLDLFKLVSEYMSGRGQVIRQMFDEMDEDKSGTLDVNE
eukprot:6359684-Pyramimonas_sp.AAC.1